MDIDTLASKNHWVHGSMNKPFTLIVALYLSEQTSLDLAVKEIISVVNEAYYGGDSERELDDTLKDLWSSILHASKKIPRQKSSQPPDVASDSQIHLLALLTSLQAQPDPIAIPQAHTSLLDMDALPSSPLTETQTQTKTKSIPIPGPSSSIALDWGSDDIASSTGTERRPSSGRKELSWAFLPLFEETVLQALSDEPGRRAGFSALEAQAWERFVAFLAHVSRREIVHLEGVAVAMIRWALEERHDEHDDEEDEEEGGDTATPGSDEQRHRHSRHRRIFGHMKAASGGSGDKHAARARLEATRLNVYVAAAALWAIVMGEELWQRRGEEDESPAQVGRISKRRWQMWIDRLQFLCLRQDLTISTRELAAEAAAVMRRVT